MRNIILFIVLLFFVCSCSRTSSYYVRLGNIGNTGVIVLDGPLKYVLPLKIDQGLDGRDTASPLSKAIKFNYIMPPDEITLTWQLADLDNCKIVEQHPKRLGYSIKVGCDWHSIPNKIFTKTIDLREAKKSKAFKEKGSWGGMFKSRRIAAIILDFDDDKVVVTTTSWSKNHLAETSTKNNKVLFAKIDEIQPYGQ